MFRNYFKIALRTLLRHKSFSLINLVGLTIGTTSCLYILLFVQNHYDYDKHHVGAKNLYRIISDISLGGDSEVLHMSTCSPPIPLTMQSDFPEVLQAARVCIPPGIEQNTIRVDDRVFTEDRGYYADSTLFSVLQYDFIEGNIEHALDLPYSVVLSEQLKTKLFGDALVVGKVIRIGGSSGEKEFKITGVYDNDANKSHLMPSFFMTMNSGGIAQYVRTSNSWAGNNFIYGYVRLQKGSDPRALEGKLAAFLKKHGEDQLREIGMHKELRLQPVTEIHTTTGLNADMAGNTSSTFLKILLLIAGFIQLVACINFMNLMTARSTRRAKEVGVRKVVGAPKQALVWQFLSESLIFTVISVILAFALLQIIKPFLNTLTGMGQELAFNWHYSNLGIVGILVLLTGLFAGSYPAFYLSSIKPISMMRGSGPNASDQGASFFRKGLVVGQFVIATLLIIGAMIIHLQLNHMLKKDLGFDQNQKMVFSFDNARGSKKLETFRNEIARLSEVSATAAVGETPAQSLIQDFPLYKSGNSMTNATDVLLTYVDDHFIETMEIGLLAGRSFRMNDTSTVRGYIRVVMNKSAIEQLGIPLEDAPGTVVYSDFQDIHIEANIVGVMDDVSYQKLGEEMGPFMLVAESSRNLRNLIVNVNTEDYPQFIEKAKSAWDKTVSDLPFEYSFLDTDIAQLYASERTLSKIITAFTMIAILISCLGLFGLAAFAAERRMKEISIRKVLGASFGNIVMMLSRDFLKLILIAIIIAAPLAQYFMDKWLQGFHYRIEIQWWVYATAGLLAVLIAFCTIGFQSAKAAWADPIEALKNE